MDPQQLAGPLCEELKETLAESGVPAALLKVLAVRPPADLAPDSFFLVTGTSSEHAPLTLELPAGLAVAYLADEEAAVDEWKRWVGSVAWRFLPRPTTNSSGP